MFRERWLKWGKIAIAFIFALMCFGMTQRSAMALNVTYYSQKNPSWMYKPIPGGWNMYNSGCTTTAAAMVFDYYGANLDPGTLNDYLNSHSGYTSGGYLKWDVAEAAANANGGHVTAFHAYGGSATNAVNNSTINNALNAGYPVIAQVDGGSHWVVITGKTDNTFTINDPYFPSFTTLASWSNTVYEYKVYEGTPSPVGGGSAGNGGSGGGTDCTAGLANEINANIQYFESQRNITIPFAGMGKYFVKWGSYFGIDPKYILAIAGQEEDFGTDPEPPYNSWGWGPGWSGFAAGWDTTIKPDSKGPGADGSTYYDPAHGGIYMDSGWEDAIFWVAHSLHNDYYSANAELGSPRPKTVNAMQRYAPYWDYDPGSNGPNLDASMWVTPVSTLLTQIGGDPNDITFPTGYCGSGGSNPNPGGGGTGSGTNAYSFVSESPLDGKELDPGQTITKTWIFNKLGSESWSGYTWKYNLTETGTIFGQQYSNTRITSSNTGTLTQLSGSQWEATVTIKAPQSPGWYREYWQLTDSNGNAIQSDSALHNSYWVDINVKRVDNLQFISDVNYPPGAHVSVGQPFTKTWKVKNTGNVPWTTSYNLVFVSGDQMRDTNSIAVSAEVGPGSTANLNLGLKAPSRPDTYTGYWRMKDENGNFFGDTLKVQIVTTFTAHVQTTADGSAYNAKARLQKQDGGNWTTIQDWKATPFDVSDLIKGVYRVQYSEENVPAWYQIPADETFNSDNLSGSTKTFTGNYPRVDWYAEFVSQSPSGTATMKAGQMQQFTVTLKNRGAQAWTKDNFHLGLKNAGSNEAGSFFLTKAADGSDSGWTSDSRIHSNETTIGTDQNATFSFWMRAPATAGTYTEHFSLVNDGSGGFWFTDTAPHNNSAHNGPDIVWNITVQPDTPPTLQNQSITVDQDSSVTISLSPANGNGNPWVVQNSNPRHGTLSEGPDSLSAVYTPDPGYVGQDSFTVRVSDGLLTSNSATISITVKPAAAPPADPDPDPGTNVAPEPLNQDLTVTRNRPLSITLSGFDSDGDALTYQAIIVPRQLVNGRWVGGSPANGTLSGSGANLVYTPDANFRGRDSFQFQVSDGVETSTGTITITVR